MKFNRASLIICCKSTLQGCDILFENFGNFESVPSGNSVKSPCFASMDFCIQLGGAFTFIAITSEIIQYVSQSGIDNRMPHVL